MYNHTVLYSSPQCTATPFIATDHFDAQNRLQEEEGCPGTTSKRGGEEEPGARGAELWEFGLGLWFRFCVKWAQNFKHLCFSGLAELSGSEALKR